MGSKTRVLSSKVPFHPAGRGKGNHHENPCFSSELPFHSACRGKGSGIVQNSSFEPSDCLFPVPVEEKAAKRKVTLSLGATRGRGQSPKSEREPCLGRPYRETCIDHEPGKELSQTPILWQRQLLFCLAFLGECFCPNRFLFVVRPQAAKGREQSSPASPARSNEQSSPAPPARSA